MEKKYSLVLVLIIIAVAIYLGANLLSFVIVPSYNITFTVDKTNVAIGETITGIADFAWGNAYAANDCPRYGCGIFALYIDGERKQIFTTEHSRMDFGCVNAPFEGFSTVLDFQNIGIYNFTKSFSNAGIHTIELKRTEISDKILKSTGLTVPNYCNNDPDLWCPMPPKGYYGRLIVKRTPESDWTDVIVVCNQQPPAVELTAIYDRMDWGTIASETITVKAKDCPYECCEGMADYTQKNCPTGQQCLDSKCVECLTSTDCPIGEQCQDNICVFSPDPDKCQDVSCPPIQCKEGNCDSATGECSYSNIADGTSCGEDKVCKGGNCTNLNPDLTCEEQGLCTDSQTGDCIACPPEPTCEEKGLCTDEKGDCISCGMGLWKLLQEYALYIILGIIILLAFVLAWPKK